MQLSPKDLTIPVNNRDKTRFAKARPKNLINIALEASIGKLALSWGS